MSKQEEIDRLVGDIERFVTERRELRRELADTREKLDAAENAQETRVRLLKLAADGRREYAKSAGPLVSVALTGEAEVLDAAIKIVEGDDEPLYGLLPSWRWGEAGLS